MSPKAPNIGLRNVYISPGQKPRVLRPGYTYHFGVFDKQQIVFRANGREYNIFKDSRGPYIVWSSKIGTPVGLGRIRPASLDEGRNVIEGIEIKKSGTAFVARLVKKEVEQLPSSQPIESPEAVRASIEPKGRSSLRETMRDSQIAIEMARVAAEDINVINYLELSNAERLQDGDILPGHLFILGKTETYGRELLMINLSKTSAIYEVMQRARDIAAEHSGERKGLALKIADMVDENYSNLQGHGKEGVMLTLGFFQEKGGCCRHRAAELQLALQEAGVRSRYVRGRVLGGWHAWVEVDVKGDGAFSYAIDPNKGIRGIRRKLDHWEDKTMRKTLISWGIPAGNLEFYKVIDERNDNEQWYFVDRKKFNVVWRRREAPKPVQIERGELHELFGQGADVVRKNGVFLLRKRAGKATGPNVVYVTVVDRAAYDLYLAWAATK